MAVCLAIQFSKISESATIARPSKRARPPVSFGTLFQYITVSLSGHKAGTLWITQRAQRGMVYDISMKKPELATARARLFPSTYKKIVMQARKRRTSIAQIVAEMSEKM